MAEYQELIDAVVRYLNSQAAHSPPSQTWLVYMPLIASSVVAVLAFVGVVITINSNKRLQRANAGIERIRAVRKITSDVLDTCYFAMLNDSNNEDLREASKNIDLLMLHFPSGPVENEEMVHFLLTLFADIYDYGKTKDKVTRFDIAKRVVEKMSDLRQAMRIYLQMEWEKL